MEKSRQWVLLTAVGAVAILVAGWFLVVSPQHKKAHDLHTQATALDQSNASLQSQVHQLQVQQAGVPAQQRQLAQIASKIPDNPALPALIRQLSAAAKGAGVDLMSLAPGTPAAVAAPTGATGSTTLASGSAASSPLQQIPVTLQVSGSYFNVESFENALENLTRAVKVTGLSMAPGASTGASSASGPAAAVPDGVTTSISAVIYMSPVTAPVAPAAAPTAAATAPAGTSSASARTSSSSSSSTSGH